MRESRNEAMDEGATDGKYRKVRSDTKIAPGTGEEIVRANRRGLHIDFYDMLTTETPAKVNPGYR